MRWLAVVLACVLAFIVAVAAAPFFRQDPGYVLIRMHGWNIETSVLMLAAGLVGLYLSIRLVVWLWHWPVRTAQRIQQNRAQNQLEKGLLALTEGDWRGAEKALQKSGSQQGRETVKYLAAARAAQGQESPERRDEYLQLAGTGGAKTRFLVALSRAKLLVANGDYDAAAEILAALHQRRRKHPQVLELLARCYREQGRWQQTINLIPALLKANLIDDDEAAQLRRLAAQNELAGSNDISELQRRWKKLPKALRRSGDLVACFSARAEKLGAADIAEPILRAGLREQWDDRLIEHYGHAASGDVSRRISQCEKWLALHGQNAALHLALGRLCVSDELWGKAKDYLQTSLQLDPSIGAYTALGEVLERHGELEPAMICFRNALRMEQGEAPQALPVLGQRLGGPVPRLTSDESAEGDGTPSA